MYAAGSPLYFSLPHFSESGGWLVLVCSYSIPGLSGFIARELLFGTFNGQSIHPPASRKTLAISVKKSGGLGGWGGQMVESPQLKASPQVGILCRVVRTFGDQPHPCSGAIPTEPASSLSQPHSVVLEARHLHFIQLLLSSLCLQLPLWSPWQFTSKDKITPLVSLAFLNSVVFAYLHRVYMGCL